jgi:hypothetical protein
MNKNTPKSNLKTQNSEQNQIKKKGKK